MRLYCESLLNSPSAHLLNNLSDLCFQKIRFLHIRVSLSPFKHSFQLFCHFGMRLSQKLAKLRLKFSTGDLHLQYVDNMLKYIGGQQK